MKNKPKKWSYAWIITLLCLFACFAVAAGQRNKKKVEPKTEVLALPPELPKALAADTATLDFHISPLLKTGGLTAQIRQSLSDLLRDTHGETIVKLRAFVAGAGDVRQVELQVAQTFTERKLPLPVLSTLQVGALADETAQVVIEAVVSTHRTLNPNGLAFLAGQTGDSMQVSLERMQKSLQAASIAPGQVLTCTCFTPALSDYNGLEQLVRRTFPNTSLDVVQPLREPETGTSMCEAVAQLSQTPSQGPLVWFSDSRAALVRSPQIIFTGLQLTFGNYLNDAQEAFTRLQQSASALGAAETPVTVNAFSLSETAAGALLRTSHVPPSVFTVQAIEGLPAMDASSGIEAVLAPQVASPIIVQK